MTQHPDITIRWNGRDIPAGTATASPPPCGAPASPRSPARASCTVLSATAVVSDRRPCPRQRAPECPARPGPRTGGPCRRDAEYLAVAALRSSQVRPAPPVEGRLWRFRARRLDAEVRAWLSPGRTHDGQSRRRRPSGRLAVSIRWRSPASASRWIASSSAAARPESRKQTGGSSWARRSRSSREGIALPVSRIPLEQRSSRSSPQVRLFAAMELFGCLPRRGAPGRRAARQHTGRCRVRSPCGRLGDRTAVHTAAGQGQSIARRVGCSFRTSARGRPPRHAGTARRGGGDGRRNCR